MLCDCYYPEYYPDHYNCEVGFLIKKNGFGVRLKQTNKTITSKYVQHPPEMGEQWRQPLVKQFAPNPQNPNQIIPLVLTTEVIST